MVQFVAQLILLEIFWEWGTKTVDDKLDEEENNMYVPLDTVDFDDDFDLEAKIWNTIIT